MPDALTMPDDPPPLGPIVATRPADGQRLVGLDFIRFVCALWVVLSHYGPPALLDPDRITLPGKLVNGFMGIAFNGVAAVMVFFVISGLCIHFPQRSRVLDIPVFIARRYIRIGLPLLAALALTLVIPGSLDELKGVIWSLYCEIIYYTLYPLLLAAAKRWSWWSVLALATASSATLMVARPEVNYIWGYGPALTWIVGLPCWIAGCLIAERGIGRSPVSLLLLNALRLGIQALAMLYVVLFYHTGFGGPYLLVLFAFVSAWWLTFEIATFPAHPPWRLLEAAGAMSYSLYLCHMFASAILPRQGSLGPFLHWLLLLLISFVVSVLFYFAVERPSHALARRIRRRSQRSAA